MNSLDQIYRDTDYIVGDHVIKIDEPHPELDKMLISKGVKCWAFITWYNPHGESVDAEENQLLHSELREFVGSSFIEAEGRGPDGWIPETSLLILGADRKVSETVASIGKQIAYVYGEVGSPAELIYTRSAS